MQKYPCFHNLLKFIYEVYSKFQEVSVWELHFKPIDCHILGLSIHHMIPHATKWLYYNLTSKQLQHRASHL
jgi:hypothetical protein